MLRSLFFGLVCLAYVQAMLLTTLEEEDWNLFKLQHGKRYKDDREEAFRKKVYMENKLKIIQHNKLYENGVHNYSMAMNEFGDMLHHEFKRVMNGLKRNYNMSMARHIGTTYISPVYTNVPDQKDWRKEGAVTPIKNQGQCGSCWSFSTTGSLEGQHFRKTGRLVSLSEQNLMDCSTAYGNEGCNGGLMDQAFQYVRDNGGIDTEKSYPYLAEDEKCKFKKADVGATDTGYVDVPHRNEEKLKEAVANIGPVSVAIDAGQQSFQFYHQGVYDEPMCSQTQLDHGVLVVGYGVSKRHGDYWIVKNSWGTSWGLNGYIRMSRNKDNQCGIATQASYPLV